MTDICNMENWNLSENEEFPDFALQTKVAWSKNVNEECNCCNQIIIGANNHEFCFLITMAVYLECHFTNNWGSPWFLFDGKHDADDKPLCMNANYNHVLKKIWDKAEFKQLRAEVWGNIGTYSIQKFASLSMACLQLRMRSVVDGRVDTKVQLSTCTSTWSRFQWMARRWHLFYVLVNQ